MSNILHSQAAPEDRADVLAHFATNVRRLRKARGLSQQSLAVAAGVSRRMINAIETDNANVSLSTVDKLAAVLGVTFTQLVRPEDSVSSARIESLAWRGKRRGSKAILLGAATGEKETELWVWTLAPGERYSSEDDSHNWSEMIFVLEGMLTIEREDGVHSVEANDFLIFSSPSPYVFCNIGKQRCRYIRNVVL